MFPPGILQQMTRAAEQLLVSNHTGNAVDAILHWRTVSGLPSNYDPNDESSAQGGTVVEEQRPFRALFHQIAPRLSGYQRFAEIQTGDVIIDYLADLSLDEKSDTRIQIGSSFYVQKNAGTALREAWDLQSGASGVFKTLLLTPAS